MLRPQQHIFLFLGEDLAVESEPSMFMMYNWCVEIEISML